MQSGIGDRAFERVYRWGKYLPQSLKTLLMKFLSTIIVPLELLGINRLVRTYDGVPLYFYFFDGPSLLYFLFSIKGNSVQETPFKAFDYPDYFDTAIDVGAHFGATAIVLGKGNDIELFCFEPNSYNVSVLERNLAQNDIPATIIQKVVSDERKTMNFFEDGNIASNDHTTTPGEKRSAYGKKFRRKQYACPKKLISLNEQCSSRSMQKERR
jgi:FkbM family methyltransferase